MFCQPKLSHATCTGICRARQAQETKHFYLFVTAVPSLLTVVTPVATSEPSKSTAHGMCRYQESKRLAARCRTVEMAPQLVELLLSLLPEEAILTSNSLKAVRTWALALALIAKGSIGPVEHLRHTHKNVKLFLISQRGTPLEEFTHLPCDFQESLPSTNQTTMNAMAHVRARMHKHQAKRRTCRQQSCGVLCDGTSGLDTDTNAWDSS